MTGIGEAVSAVRGAYAVARAAKDVTDKVKLDTAVSEVLDALGNAQSALLELQQQHFELLDENRQMREQLAREARFDRYYVEKTPLGGFVLRLKPEEVTPQQPDHRACPNCREHGRLSMLAEEDLFYRCLVKDCGFLAEHTENPGLGIAPMY